MEPTDYIEAMYKNDQRASNGDECIEVIFNGTELLRVKFQEGTVNKPEDVNGCTIEDLLVIAHGRLNYFQHTLPDYHNEMALRHIEEALLCLHSRIIDRRMRGVEGTDNA